MTFKPQPSSQWDELEVLLNRVTEPVQYVGEEINSVSKSWDEVRVHWVLMYPDAYSVGQPNQGLAILYELINELDYASAERTFSVWPDLAELMRAKGLSQFTWESHRPVRGYDILGISLSTDCLLYTSDAADE